MHIIIHVAAMATESLLRLGCSDVIPQLVIENMKRVLSVVQATITDFPHLLIKTSRSLQIPITTSICLTFMPSFLLLPRQQ